MFDPPPLFPPLMPNYGPCEYFIISNIHDPSLLESVYCPPHNWCTYITCQKLATHTQLNLLEKIRSHIVKRMPLISLDGGMPMH